MQSFIRFMKIIRNTIRIGIKKSKKKISILHFSPFRNQIPLVKFKISNLFRGNVIKKKKKETNQSIIHDEGNHPSVP